MLKKLKDNNEISHLVFKKSSSASHLQITAILVPNRPEDLPVGTLLSVASGGKNLKDKTNTKS